MQSYDFQIVRKEGKANFVADCLSRRSYPHDSNQTETNTKESNVAELLCKGETVQVEFYYDQNPTESSTILDPESKLNDLSKIAQLQRECEDFKDILLYLEQDILPDDPKKRRKIVSKAEFYDLCNGVLYHCFQKRMKNADENDGSNN